MAENKQEKITVDTALRAYEHRIALGSKFDGQAQSLSGEPFAPYASEVDGVVGMKQHDTPANDEGDTGGLFEFEHDKPIIIEQILGNLGASMNWTLDLQTTLGDLRIDAAAGTQLVTRVGHDQQFKMVPGEKLKFISTANAAGWLRVYARIDPAG